MKKAVVLLSGGIDSALCAAVAKEKNYEIYTINFDYGQRNRKEIEAAGKISRGLGALEHKTFTVDLRQIGGSAITDREIDVPRKEEKGVPVTYVPARNLIFLSIAASWAEVLEASAVFIGVNVRDYSGYPDCRADFIAAFEKAVGLGTKKETKISVKAPLLLMNKQKIIEEARSRGIDIDITSSCYNSLEYGRPCGECPSCRIRNRALEKLKEKEND